MARLENLTRGVQVKGVRNGGPVQVVDVEWWGTGTIELTRDTQGTPGNDLPLPADAARVGPLLAARGTPGPPGAPRARYAPCSAAVVARYGS